MIKMKSEEKYPEFPEDRKSSLFKVPENYFEEFPEKLMGNIPVNISHSAKTPVYRFLRPVIAVAASFLFIFILYSGYQKLKSKETIQSFQTISEDQVIEENLLSEDDLMEALASTDEPAVISSDDEAINYLVENEIENSDIIAEN
jgi:hypothetical protein